MELGGCDGHILFSAHIPNVGVQEGLRMTINSSKSEKKCKAFFGLIQIQILCEIVVKEKLYGR